EGQDDLAQSLAEAGKAAGKNLQAFDEVHTLQKDMAVDTPSLDEAGFGLEDMGDLVGFDIGDLMSEMDAAKPTLAGWWEDIKQTWRERWNTFTTWLGGVWDRVKANWETFKEWVKSWRLWSWLGEQWGSFTNWASGLWDGVK